MKRCKHLNWYIIETQCGRMEFRTCMDCMSYRPGSAKRWRRYGPRKRPEPDPRQLELLDNGGKAS